VTLGRKSEAGGVMLREAIESGNEQLRSGLRPVPRFSMAGSH
jgi:hypothetical protein